MDIANKIKYESSFLSNLFKMHKVVAPYEFDAIYLLEPGKTPLCKNFARISVDMNDWRAMFRSIGAPLAYIAGFKIIDLIVEFLIGSESNKVIQFQEKLVLLKNAEFPTVMEENRFLIDYLCSVFDNGYMIRNVLVHRSTFSADNSGIVGNIFDKKGDSTSFLVSWDNIYGLATFAILLSDSITAGKMPRLNCKNAKRALDSLYGIHKLPRFMQARPAHCRAKIFRLKSEKIDVNFASIVDFINSPIQMMDFDTEKKFMIQRYDFDVELEIIIMNDDNSLEGVYRIPHEKAITYSSVISISNISQFRVYPGEDISLDCDVNFFEIGKSLSEGKRELLESYCPPSKENIKKLPIAREE